MQGGEGTVGQLDVIALRGITAEAVHGVLEKEWNAPQTFTVDLLLWVDTDRAVSACRVSTETTTPDAPRR